MRTAYHGCISPDHPALPGHFPGNPIVPGVVLLTETLRAVERSVGPVRLLELPTVKFTAPLHPGQTFTITLDQLEERRLTFTVRCRETTMATGTIRYTGIPREGARSTGQRPSRRAWGGRVQRSPGAGG